TQTIAPIPRTRATRRVDTFSTKIIAERPAIQTRLIEPATNSTNMNSQQHPRQYAAWLSPIRSAPPRPDRQCRVTNIIGDWQWVRHTSFASVTWYTPAARRTAPGARAASPTIGPMRPRAASATRASPPNTPQIKKYG